MTTDRHAPEPSVTEVLARFAAGVPGTPVPADALHGAERLLLDTIGCMVGGSTSEAARRSRSWLDHAGPSGGDEGTTGAAGTATIVGSATRASALAASYANGRAAAALDADETYPSDRQTAHLAAATVAVALAVHDERGAAKADLLAAIATGYDVGARLCDAVIPAVGQAGRALQAGWGPGSVLGATAAAGRAYGLDAARIAHAIGIAGTHIDAPPLQWSTTTPAPMTKSADAGWHAMTALAGAQMAAEGLTGYDRILDGEQGLWRALGYAGWDAVAATDRLGDRWIVCEAAFKRWPCQYWMQPALTALRLVLDEHDLGPDELEAVELATNDKCLAPRFLAADPASEIDRAFNFPHAVAMLALGIPAGPRWSAEDVAVDPRVQRLRGLVRVVRHPHADRIPGWVVDHQIRDLPARATVSARGVTFVRETHFGIGNPWSPATRLSDAALAGKFLEMTAGMARAEAIVAWVLGAPADAPVRDLTAMLGAAGAATTASTPTQQPTVRRPPPEVT